MTVDPYENLTDEQVLAKAARALRKVNALPMGSTERALQWAVFESAKAELDLRMARHILAALDRRRQGNGLSRPVDRDKPAP